MRRAGRGAVVLGADYRGLGIVRSLGRRGLPVCVVRADGDRGSATSSRFCTESARWPDDDSEREALLLDLARAGGARRWALFPTGDETAAYVARHHELLRRHYVLTTPDWETFRWAYDKRSTYRLADCVGVDHPRTVAVRCRADVCTYEGPFPALLKPAAKPRLDRLAHDKAWPVQDREELVERYDEAVALGDADLLMVQEAIEGPAEQLSFAALWRDGDPIASVTARRRRQFPVDIGRSSTYVESVEDPMLERLARRLAGAIRLSGLAEMEFVRTPDGTCALLDFNARVWGWHTIARRAGLDFPWLTWRQAHGDEVHRQRAPEGIGWMRLITDLPAAAQGLANRRTTIAGYVRSLLQPHERAILAFDDPLPGVLEVPAYLSSRLRSAPTREPAQGVLEVTAP